jgi:hypothetical protein
MKKRVTVLYVSLMLLVGAIFVPTLAQDTMEEKAVCDSSLATLILVAEYHYDYLSHMMMDESMMAMMPNLDYGQYQPLIDEIMTMMMEMMEEGSMMEETMTPEEIAAHDEMLANLMAMESKDAIVAYLTSMNMEMSADASMTVLTPGNVADEDPACAAARADVEKFLLAHIITSMSMMGM